MVTAFTSKVEVGQGSRTQITQAVAEELFVPVDKIRLVMADTELCPDDGGTAGSRTTPATVPSVRRSAAQARELLAAMAAARLGAERSQLSIGDGTFADSASGKQVTLAELAADADFAAAVRGRGARRRHASRPSTSGECSARRSPKTTGRDVVTGAHQYPSDIRRPGMLYGKVLRPSGVRRTAQFDRPCARGGDGRRHRGARRRLRRLRGAHVVARRQGDRSARGGGTLGRTGGILRATSCSST